MKDIRIFAILFLLVFTLSCQKDPIACFNVSDTNPYVGDSVKFTNCSTGADSYQWDFDDGTTSGQESETHAYNSPGTYIVSLLAIADADTRHFVTETIIVEEAPDTINVGKVIFWRQGNAPFDSDTVMITINCPEPGYEGSGLMSQTFEYGPECNTEGALTYTYPIDLLIGWQVTNTFNGYTEDRPAFTVEKDGCLKLRVD